MKENLGNVTAESRNTFKDRHGRTLLGDARHRRFYIVGKENEKVMTLMENRYIIVFAVLILIGFRFGWLWGLLVAAVVFVGFGIFYRKIFLPTLNTIENVDVPKTHSSIYLAAESSSIGKNILRCGASVMTSLLLLLNMNLTIKDWSVVFGFKDFSQVFLAIFSVIASVVFMYFAYVSFQMIMKKRREK